MNKEIMIAAGFGDAVKSVENGQCPFCKKLVLMTDFCDAISLKEFRISGLCMACQDEMFGE